MSQTYNAWIMKPGDASIKSINIDKLCVEDYFPRGKEVYTTQHKTGIYDYYVVFFDADNEGYNNHVAKWIAKIIGIPPTGNFVILHKVWKEYDEINAPITISPQMMKELFKND